VVKGTNSKAVNKNTFLTTALFLYDSQTEGKPKKRKAEIKKFALINMEIIAEIMGKKTNIRKSYFLLFLKLNKANIFFVL
jgi:hypothetical protein